MATQTDIPLSVPDEGAMAILRRVLYGQKLHLSAFQTAPPSDELATLSDLLNGLADDLLNKIEFSTESFDGTHAATHVEVGQGRQLQLVSFSAACSAESAADQWLRVDDPASWGDRALAVGGLIGYIGGMPATSAVLLRRKDGYLRYELVGGMEGGGDWSLLQLRSEAPQPYSFFTSQWIGFSHFTMQAALCYDVPASKQTVAVARATLDVLLKSGLLPADASVAIKKARADYVGKRHAQSQCLQLAPLPGLEANLVLAAAEQCLEKEVGSELIVGAAIISVLAPIDGLAVDEQGQSVTLPVGAYRLDVLDFDEPAEPIGLLMSGEHHPYYVPLVVAEIVGQLIEGAPVEEDAPDIVVDGMSFTYCSSTGDLQACGRPEANKHRKRVHLIGNG